MKTFYYIAYRKPRGQVERYAGDGIWDAKNITTARREVAHARGVPINRLKMVERKEVEKA